MENYLQFLQMYARFLGEWQSHLVSIGFAGAMWLVIVIHLIGTKHATLGGNGDSDDYGCGDVRVWRLLVIFGGPAGLSFGLPYYWLMIALSLGGVVQEYWMGFVYVQFATSLIQAILFLLYAVVGPKSKKFWRLFKAHLMECGWVTALSPILWWTYWLKQILPKALKVITWPFRDLETVLVFLANLFTGQVILLCAVASLLNQRLIIPFITPVDHAH